MPIADPVALITALSRGLFEDLVGTPEGDWLEFKAAPYQLDGPLGKWELAKDVAAFANQGEGYIVIPVKTKRHENEIVDAAVKVSTLPKALIDADAYRKVISSWAYPTVRDLAFHWFPPETEKKEGIFVIHIRPQTSQDRPFVLRRMVDEDGKETGAVGIPRREGADTDWTSAERIHHLISRGTTPTDTEARESRFPEGHDFRAGPPSPEALAARADSRIDEIEETQGWEETPLYVLQTLTPVRGSVFEGLFDRSGPASALSQPPSLRGAGFNLRVGGERELRDGGVLYRSHRVTVWLESDGLFTAAAIGTPRFLGWGINESVWTPTPESERPLRVNAVVLVEFTLEYFRFVHQHLAPHLPGKWRSRVVCRRFQQGRLALSAGAPRQPLDFADGNPASSDEWTQTIQTSQDAGRDAFLTLANVYALFGLGRDAIPFTDDDSISEEAIRSL